MTVFGSYELAPSSSDMAARNRFTMKDRCDLLDWHATLATFGARSAYYSFPDAGVVGGGDYLLIYRDDRQWASWGVVRQDGHLLVWNCAAGVDLGVFPSLSTALAAVIHVWAASWRQPGCFARETGQRKSKGVVTTFGRRTSAPSDDRHR